MSFASAGGGGGGAGRGGGGAGGGAGGSLTQPDSAISAAPNIRIFFMPVSPILGPAASSRRPDAPWP
ncbi:MAG: hypothetical protein EON94_04735 [Caulobacteraceae bacterium]|nr:MAG: hypothetical protein EON94_04735 [Caulobacteraceae bacterium]